MSELKEHDLVDIQDYRGEVYLKSEVDAVLAEKDKEIAELKCQVNGLRNRSNLWYYNAVEEHKKFVQVGAVLAEKDSTIAELKQKLESVQASMDADLVDAGMENRRLQRALWVTRTAWAKSEKDRWDSHVDCGNKRNRKDPAFVKTGKLLDVSEWRKLWADNERKCRAKAEEYK